MIPLRIFEKLIIKMRNRKKNNRLLWERAWYELIKALIPKDPDNKLQQLLGRMNGTKENDAGLKLKK